jgi:rare lipoprotein A
MLAREFVLPRSLLAILGLIFSTAAANAAWTGKASYYGLHGRTASGAHLGAMTAAHRSLPFGTPLRVTNLKNGHTVVVRVNDRRPFTRGRIIDVSTQAADALGFRRAGITMVRVERVGER